MGDKCDLKEYILTIVNQLYLEGLQKSDVLAWKWDDMINFGEHGICGIVYIMMKAMEHINDNSLIEQINTVLKNTIEYVYKI
jgi:lantibiotic modifying enzyme